MSDQKIRPMRPTSDQGWQAVDAAYAAVKLFPPRDQVTATAWAMVAALRFPTTR